MIGAQRSVQRGFALAAVLWLLAGLSIVVTLVADSAKTSAERVAQLRERTEFVRGAVSARGRMEYWLSATRPRSADFFDGVQGVRVDQTAYLANDSNIVQLQDVGGLINLNRFERNLMTAFLTQCGVPAEQTPSLIDALEDYIDADSLQRINGAERDSYSLAGKVGPRNGPLLSEAEIWSVLGWSVYKSKLENNGCFSDYTVSGQLNELGNSLNLATATARVLKAAGLSDDAVADIDNARRDPEKVGERVAQNAELNGSGGLFGGAGGLPSQKTLRVIHRAVKGPWTMDYVLVLDPDNDDRPWSVTQPRVGASPSPTGKLNPLPWPAEAPGSIPSDVSRIFSL